MNNKKSGSHKDILPPSFTDLPEEDLIPKSKISPFLEEFVLEPGKDALDPETFEKFEPEVTKHRRVLHPQIEDIDPESIKKYDEASKTHSEKYKTVRPGKRAKLSVGELIKLCYTYYRLATK